MVGAFEQHRGHRKGCTSSGAVRSSVEKVAIVILVTASGVSFFGVSGAFWGLIAGGALYALRRRA